MNFREYVHKNKLLVNNHYALNMKKSSIILLIDQAIILLYNETSHLPEEFTQRERIFLLLNKLEIKDIRCPVGDCESLRRLKINRPVLLTTCNLNDEYHKKYIQKIKTESSIKTCQVKYGVNNPGLIPGVHQKIKDKNNI